MKLPRRKILHWAAAAAALPALRGIAFADDYPSRPVHIVTGYPAGASPDIIARLVAENLSQRLGQQFIVDDRPGAASNIGTDCVRSTMWMLLRVPKMYSDIFGFQRWA